MTDKTTIERGKELLADANDHLSSYACGVVIALIQELEDMTAFAHGLKMHSDGAAAENEELRDALKPFGSLCQKGDPFTSPCETDVVYGRNGTVLTVADFRRAASLTEGK